jgi:hypothetical protein
MMFSSFSPAYGYCIQLQYGKSIFQIPIIKIGDGIYSTIRSFLSSKRLAPHGHVVALDLRLDLQKHTRKDNRRSTKQTEGFAVNTSTISCSLIHGTTLQYLGTLISSYVAPYPCRQACCPMRSPADSRDPATGSPRLW